MLALALAILGSPRCLLLDEPSIGLAPNLVERLFQQVRDLCRSHAMTAILVEQNVAAAMQIADRVIIMNNGRIVFDGLPQEAREFEFLELFLVGLRRGPTGRRAGCSCVRRAQRSRTFSRRDRFLTKE